MPSLDITYTPNYEGCHNIGFRPLDSVSDYCLYKDNSASVVGTSKTVEINLSAEQLACLGLTEYQCISTIELEGYVQACCSAEGEDLVPFTITALSTGCRTYEVGCTGAPIGYFTVTNPGSGYTINPVVTITHGDGSGAVLEAIALGGNITAVVPLLSQCGNGYTYTNPPTVTIAAPDTPGITATAELGLLRSCVASCGGDESVRVAGCYSGVVNRVYSPTAGASYYVCSLTTPNISFVGPYATVTELDSTACCSCKYYNIENVGDVSTEYFYIDCNGAYQNQILLTSGSNVNVCATENSIHGDNYSEVIITLLAEECP